jgi:hypothetical protein
VVDPTLGRAHTVLPGPVGRLPDVGGPGTGARFLEATLEFGLLVPEPAPLLHALATDPPRDAGLAATVGFRRSPKLPRRDGGGTLA